jgi:hypothetical protein
MSEDKEAFLDRWSRLKRERPREEPADVPAVVPQAKPEPAAPLQPVEELKPDSDFRPFMDPQVDPGTRRSALKKLFADAHYNVPDPFEAYSEDYTKSVPIPEKMLRAINRVRDVALRGEEKVVEEERLAEQARAQQKTASVQDEPPHPEQVDVAGKQDA